MRELHLICNAHLDPVWLWRWEEGAAEALSTFRIAAEFCEEYDGYVFNHNEAVLYEWIEEYDSALFTRIQRLVAEGRWHIMGGWYLQPDCNLPSGESLVRQILYGRRYFSAKFGARPTTAINFDPFGHSRGLVQILAKSGFDSYIFGRPSGDDLELPAEEFTWVGFDGSEIVAHRPFGHYLSHRGEALEKAARRAGEGWEHGIGLLLWGIGNHGGGASREDLEAIAAVMEGETPQDDPGAAAALRDVRLLHSTPEAYFAARREAADTTGDPGGTASAQPPRTDQAARELVAALGLPRHADHLNPWAPGCYTSQIRIKQNHRALEDGLFSVEKMAMQATVNGLLAYPRAELREALRDLMFGQFHDILPGSSIPAAEEDSLVRLGHGLEIVARVRARCFFALTRGEPRPADDDIPIFVYNPHPFAVDGVFEVEFQPAGQNRAGTFTSYRVRRSSGRATPASPPAEVPVQFEKEASTVGVDWRKRMIVRATLPPAALSRFDCTPNELPARPTPQSGPDAEGKITVANDRCRVVIDATTGLIVSYVVDASEVLAAPGPRPLVLHDSDDAWESRGRAFRNVAGEFRLATPAEAARVSGVRSAERAPVRVIEEGPVRTVVEAIFVYGGSELILTYHLPRTGSELKVSARVIWTEKHSMLKLGLPVRDAYAGRFLGQTAYGVQRLATNGEEAVAQRWIALAGGTDADGAGRDDARALTVANDGTYGCSLDENELRLTLLRSPAYSGLPVGGAEPDIPQDRFTPRIDQGERLFTFRLQAGRAEDRLAAIDRESTAHGESPMFLMLYPSPDSSGRRDGSRARSSSVTLSDDVVQLSALKAAEDGDGYVARLYEPTGRPRVTTLSIPGLDVDARLELRPFEVATYRIGGSSRGGVPGGAETVRIEETNLIEEEML